ncbi:hypothetical protein RclHR1_11350009 [Rhizophagus clarus]|uniref:Uncharacterized protein n=1 Tax=Rhizophagus clarus TaxID=94130 RepID=A0A2Z6Q3U8_9GLOM|nr:hypothetical protein RclHR1_11350009 [Rhizophagus clarus]
MNQFNLKLHFETDHCPELHFEADDCPELYFETDHCPELYFERTIKSRTPLGADYDISKSGTSLEADYCNLKKWTKLFRRSRTLIRSGPCFLSFLGLEEADHGISKVQNSKWTEDGHHLAVDQIYVFPEASRGIQSFPDVYWMNFED